MARAVPRSVDARCTHTCLDLTSSCAPPALRGRVAVRCACSWEGLGLLRGSVERSKGVNATRSCTIFIEDKLRCIYDGGEFYDCDGGSDEQVFELRGGRGAAPNDWGAASRRPSPGDTRRCRGALMS